MLDSLSKMDLVGIGRKLGLSMGDYARASKVELIEKLKAGASLDILHDMAKGNAFSLSPGIVPVPHPTSPIFVAPTYEDICVVRSEKASKVFGVRSLGDLMVDVWNDPGAPDVMETFRFNPKHLKQALTALNRQRPVWLGGPAGTGKTEFVKQLAARLGRSFIRVQFDASLEAYHVIGGERVKAASTVWQDGLVLQGFRRPGAIILLDEVGFARSEYTSSLHAAIEPAGVVTIPETGEVVRRAKGVTFFAADNSNGRGDHTGVYVGVREQNNAFLNRFARFLEFTYLPPEDEAGIIADQSGANAQVSRLIADFIGVCRAKADTGALESPPTMREAFYLAEALMDGIPARDAFEITVVNRAPVDCKEILQQLWVANVDASMIDKAMAGEQVALKTAPVAPVAPVVVPETF